jgi:small conductance mechanosensitive channel
MTAALNRQPVDPTLTRYFGNIVNVGLTIALIVAVLGYFGVETTSFAALVAGVGVAIGAAWAGLLSNFAAGAFLIVLRPFKVGDYVKVAGIDGTVRDIGIFSTTVEAADHVIAFVGNNKIFSDTIHNYSASPTRRVERTAQLAHGVDVKDAIARLKQAIAKIPNVAKTPEPIVEIVDFNSRGPVLAVRPYTHNDNYMQVYFDTNLAIADTFGEAGYPIPTEHVTSQQAAPKAIAA